MSPIQRAVRGLAAASLLSLLLSPAPQVRAGGFSVFEQGTKAMGMAGAFTAQADDPSALFHNVGGLAFVEERQVAVGLTLVTSTDEEFVGRAPGFAAGTTASLESLREPVPHLYWVQPVGDTWSFGLAVNAPFGLKTEWEDPATFAGRFINTEASLFVVDVNPNLGVRLGERFGVGFGPIVRFSSVELNRNQGLFLPAFGRVVDVAAVELESDLDRGYGWQAGALHRVSDRLSWGFSYRSRVEVEYAGDARFREIVTVLPGLGPVPPAPLPFGVDLPVETEIEFPDMASLGVAVGLSDRTLVELDVNWVGWSTFDALVIAFPTAPQFTLRRPEEWDDVFNVRLGLRWDAAGGSQWRCGVLYDESPQPDRSVSPLLPDADRNGYSVGWGRQGRRLSVDLALLYLDFDDRTTRTSIDDFNGTYSQTGWLFAGTVGF